MRRETRTRLTLTPTLILTRTRTRTLASGTVALALARTIARNLTRCADLNRLVPELMGVSPAVLENVIFVHQARTHSLTRPWLGLG